MLEKIVILDFGGQYNQLIARRVREAGVYCEIMHYATPMETWAGDDLRGIILTGGPNSVYEEGAPRLGKELFSLGVPVLGICYGMQLINYILGGTNTRSSVGEYGHTELTVRGGRLFEAVSPETVVFMNHTDRVAQMPEGFSCDASTGHCPVAAFSCPEKGVYGVQFHPEVRHTVEGTTILRNFVLGVCGCKGDYRAEDMIEGMLRDIRAQVGEGKVVAGLSGGVDSSVACALAERALAKGQLTCVFVDHGLLRLDEAKSVLDTYRDVMGLNVVYVDASERFLTALSGVTDPEKKRKIIGELFVRVFEEEAKKTGAQFLLQGTIYPDRIESGMGGSATIKSHHNVGGLPRDSLFKKENIVEPLKSLFKDEVRAVGEALTQRSTVWSGGSHSPAPALPCAWWGRSPAKSSTSSAGATPSIWKSWKTPAFPKTSGSPSPYSPGSKTVGRDGRWPHLRLLRRPARRDQRRRHDRGSRGASLPGAEKMRQPHHQ